MRQLLVRRAHLRPSRLQITKASQETEGGLTFGKGKPARESESASFPAVQMS
jgi:hypothetical protein